MCREHVPGNMVALCCVRRIICEQYDHVDPSVASHVYTATTVMRVVDSGLVCAALSSHNRVNLCFPTILPNGTFRSGQPLPNADHLRQGWLPSAILTSETGENASGFALPFPRSRDYSMILNNTKQGNLFVL